MLHLHGNLFACRCIECAYSFEITLPADAADAPLLRRSPPRCLQCGGEVRPGVAWFGEVLPEATWNSAMQAPGKGAGVIRSHG